MENKKIKSFFSKSLKKKHINKIHNGFNISKVWNIMLIFFIIVIVFIVAISLYLFFQISSGEIFLVEQKTPVSVETINRTQMQKTIDLFDKKARAVESLKSASTSEVVDPSL